MKRLLLLRLSMIISVILVNSKIGKTQDCKNEYNLTATTTNRNYNKLIWSDEFNEDGVIDSTKWFHQTRLPNSGSWYNNEIQHYTNRIDNSFIDTGYLNIVAKKEEFSDQGYTKKYTSARLNSKFAFKYGEIVIRAKLPSGAGTWPAIWMLGKNINENGGYWDIQGFGNKSWPACGEIDIMEHWGTNQDYISSATHTPSSYGATINIGGQIVTDASTEFHIYKLEWTPQELIFSVDDVTHYIYNPSEKNDNTWPFDKEFYLLLNVAVLPSISNDFIESSLVIDYVRVYQDSTSSAVLLTKSQNLDIYPNPFNSEITIDLEEVAKQDIVINIYNINTRLINTYRMPVDGNRITLKNLDTLSSGVYIISFEINKKLYNYRITKK